MLEITIQLRFEIILITEIFPYFKFRANLHQ
jgi:hypothetical protein